MNYARFGTMWLTLEGMLKYKACYSQASLIVHSALTESTVFSAVTVLKETRAHMHKHTKHINVAFKMP